MSFTIEAPARSHVTQPHDPRPAGPITSIFYFLSSIVYQPDRQPVATAPTIHQLKALPVRTHPATQKAHRPRRISGKSPWAFLFSFFLLHYQ